MSLNRRVLKIDKVLAALAASALLWLCACEERAYEKAESANTIEAYERFLNRYPDGKKNRAAQGHIAHLKYKRALKQNTVAAYEEYLQQYPYTISRPTILQRLSILVEPEVNSLTVEQMSGMRAELKTRLGIIKIRLFPDRAPETCRNFIKLARSHFYNLTQFHLLIPGELIEGGSPEGDPRGGPGYVIKDEINDLKNLPGAVGMALIGAPDTAGSRFYICLRAFPERDGKYTIFGQVTEGLEVVEAISNLETSGPQGRPFPYQPLKPVVIQSIVITQE